MGNSEIIDAINHVIKCPSCLYRKEVFVNVSLLMSICETAPNMINDYEDLPIKKRIIEKVNYCPFINIV